MTPESPQLARLTSIELENFKGVGERVRVELKPITLLFGANSAGKSTILQALQYVREVLERRNANPDRTLYGGDFVDLGGFRNLVHGRDLSKRIGIKLELALNDESLPDFFADLIAWQPIYDLLNEVRFGVKHVSVRLEVSWSTLRQTTVVTGYEVGIDGEWFARITATEDGRDVRMQLNKLNPAFLRRGTPEDRETAEGMTADLGDWVVLEDINEVADATAVPSITSEASTDQSPSDTYSVLPSILVAAREAGVSKPGAGLRTWLWGFDSALPHLGTLLSVLRDSRGDSDNINIARNFAAFMSSLVVGPGMLVRDCLRKLRYLGPIRNVPRRDFEAALTSDEARWADGLAAWERLMTCDENLVRQVGDWMSSPDKLGTGYEIERRYVEEVDANVVEVLRNSIDDPARFTGLTAASLSGLRARRKIELVESRTGLSVQPRDVGIGISQVLPVVVAALEPSAGIVAIEQPELHIHPAVQVGLGDLFTRAATDNGSVFLIETHSEHLILRLLRRIRETTEGEAPPGFASLTPENVGVFFVERNDAGQVVISRIEIDAMGKFVDRWPRGFFAERMLESLPTKVRQKVEARDRTSE